MNFLITGASGYIGSAILNLINNKNNRIIVVSKKGKRYFPKIDNLSVINYDDHNHLKKIISSIDIIIHAASINSINCKRNKKKCYTFNYQYTKNLFKLAKESKVKKFIFLSTIHVYSDFLKGLITIKSRRINNDPYAFSKRKAEDFLINSSIKKTQVIILRLSNVYGIVQNKNFKLSNSFVHQFCKEIVNKKRITINNYDKIYRNLISLNKLNQIITYIIKQNYKSAKVYNVGGKFSYKLIEIANIISDRYFALSGNRSKIISKKILRKKTDPLRYKINFPINFADNINKEIDKIIYFYKNNKFFSK